MDRGARRARCRAAPTRLALVEGRTALACTVSIAALSLPVFVLSMFALRGLASTRPRAAGAAAGLLAGAAAAAVYALHCDEMALPFLAVWYVLGVAVPAALGALLGPSRCAGAEGDPGFRRHAASRGTMLGE